MYRCQNCGKVVPPATPCHLVALQTRPKKYPARSKANRMVEWVRGKPKVKYTDDPGGQGREIVRELAMCLACVKGFGTLANQE